MLDGELISEINEYYLLHGTKKEFVDNIVARGLDFRLNEASMFGKGIYLGERSTKCDQYAGWLRYIINTNVTGMQVGDT